jgi:hypothetical protein
METSRFSETSAFTNQSTPQLNPKEQHHICQNSENIKSHITRGWKNLRDVWSNEWPVTTHYYWGDEI